MQHEKVIKGSFADGIRMINQKGALIIPVNLTKKRARILMDMAHRYRHEWNFSSDESKFDNDMQSAVQWLINQINKRWSQNELYSD